MQLSPRVQSFALVLLYAAILVAGCLWIWYVADGIAPLWRGVFITLALVGWSWDLSRDIPLNSLHPRRGRVRE
mgnify:CR=1 FL=1